MEAKSNENSYVYTQSKKELLLKLNSDYKKLEVQKLQAQSSGQQEMVRAYQAQQISIIDRMKLEAASLPSNEIPSEVSHLLR
jgi:hypothetical protein